MRCLPSALRLASYDLLRNDGAFQFTDATGSTDASAPAGTDAPAGTTAPAEVTFPLSFAQAEEQGLTDQIDWGDRCDTATGQLAVPDFFAQPCMAPFTGDNGGATDTGVTADEITIVYYEGQEGDPIIAYISDAVAADETQASLLHIKPQTPLLSVERVAYTYNDVPMELRRGLYHTSHHHYRNELS